MSDSWESSTMGEVKVGDRIRLQSGRELHVSQIEAQFFGREEMLAFIEITDSSWFKQPGRVDAPVEILRG